MLFSFIFLMTGTLRGRYCEIYTSSNNKMAGTCRENGRGSDAKKYHGRKKKKRKTSFEMDGRCGSRPEGNEDKAVVDGDDAR